MKRPEELSVSDYMRINRERNEAARAPYDPITGEGSTCIERVQVHIADSPIGSDLWLPKEMLTYEAVAKAVEKGSIREALSDGGLYTTEENIAAYWQYFIRLRVKYDFEYWAASFVVIQDKGTGYDIPFRLNRGQRKLLHEFEDMRNKRKPIRIILLKARQWGGSTLTQIYIAWLQLVQIRQWSSVICAHTENTARNVRGMYSKLLENYPLWIADTDDPKQLKLSNFENSQKTRIIKCRGCKVSIGSAMKPDGLRGLDVACAHLSEIGLFPSTTQSKPEDLVQSICSGIANKPDTIIVYESTAKGVGNFFHREWKRATATSADERSNFRPVFVAWFEIDNYTAPIDDYKEFISTLTDDEKRMFLDGATLEGIAWHREKKSEYSDYWRFASEYPSSPDEAFQSTGHPYYNPDDVKRLSETCCEPKYVGDISANGEFGSQSALDGIRFIPNSRGLFKVWAMPAPKEQVTGRYVVVVDIGGLSANADRSVICVFDRYAMAQGGVPEVVAEWCGHIAHYKLAWLSVQIATWYHDALLVIESNTLDSHKTEGVHSEFIMDEISSYYSNLYCRTSAEQVKQGVPAKYGFHTNKATKTMVCDHQRKVLEHNLYIEHCIDAVYEHKTLEIKTNGEIGATDGNHDDRHITRAIGVWVCYQYLTAPVRYEDIAQDQIWTPKMQGFASF